MVPPHNPPVADPGYETVPPQLQHQATYSDPVDAVQQQVHMSVREMPSTASVSSQGSGADRRSSLAPLPHDQDSSSSDSDSDSVGKGAGGNYIDELEQAAIARKARKRFKFSGL